MLNSKLQVSRSSLAKQAFKILLICPAGELLTNLLKLELSHEGYLVEVVHDELSGLRKFQTIKPELVVVGWSISGADGINLCYRLRSEDNSVSILTLTHGHKIADRVAALNAGANDSISVPFAMSEFLARIRVQLRKYKLVRPSVLVFEDLSLNILTREVYRGDCRIYLTTKEFNLLKYLLAHPRQVLTREQITDRIWGYDFEGDSNIIEVYIRYLRIKLEKYNPKRLIHTVRSVGYVLRESPL